MWVDKSLEQLKIQATKSKSYKPKRKDLDSYVMAFQKYFSTVSNPANFEKVIEYFVQIFIASLHLNPAEHLADCFKKLVYWLKQDRNINGPYYLIKTVVELTERRFTDALVRNAQGGGEKSSKIREISRERDLSADREKFNRKEQEIDVENPRQNLKSVLKLIRKASDKNLFDTEVLTVFFDYYLQRLSSQASVLGKQPQMLSQKSSATIPIGSEVLSQLSTILISRNKAFAASLIQKHVSASSSNSLSSFICLYLAVQLKNVPNIICPILANTVNRNKFKVPSEILKVCDNQNSNGEYSELSVYLHTRMLQNLLLLCRSQDYPTTLSLHHLYPGELANIQDLLDRLYVFMGFNQVQPTTSWCPTAQWISNFITKHIDYIQSTSMPMNPHSHLLTARFVIKLFTIVVYGQVGGQGEKDAACRQAAREIVEVMKKEVKSVKREMEEEGDSQQNKWQLYEKMIWNIYEDCKCILAYPIVKSQGIVCTNQGVKLSDYLNEHDQTKSTIYKISQAYDPVLRLQLVNFIKQKLKAIPRRRDLIEYWKIIIEVMFRLAEQQLKPAANSSEDFSNHYCRGALSALSVMEIRPPFLRRQTPAKQSLPQCSALCRACLEILELIVQHVKKEDLVSYMKKLMSHLFDKVDLETIRQKISKSIFLTKCLLMVNHTNKTKLLMDQILRVGELPHCQQHFTAYLESIFCRVPGQILPSFCKFLATREKLVFRYALFEGQLGHMEHLAECDLFELVTGGRP